MADALTKANINLFAVLRNLEDLCEMDKEAAALIKGKDLAIQFIVKDGPSAVLTFKNDRCTFAQGKGKSSITLYFRSPQHLNEMFDGKRNPIPLKGFTKLGFLKNEFMKLTERLAFYLKPTDELLSNPQYFAINTQLTLYTAFFALAQIGNYDRKGKLNAERIPDGIVSVSILDGGPSVNLNVHAGHLEPSKGPGESPRAFMNFSDSNTANAVLNGKIDSYSAMGTGDFRIKGYIPMLDNLNKLLMQVPAYLK